MSAIVLPGYMMEFQAIVMAAGRGSHMTDITSYFTKALLPVANRPMIWYPINMLEKAGFKGTTRASTKDAM